MTGLLLAVMPFVVLVTVRFRRSVQQSYRRIRVAIARINAYLQEHVNGITVLQLFNREKKSRAEFERINRDHMEAFKDAITAYGWFYPWVEFLGMLALAMLLAYGGFRIRSGALDAGSAGGFLPIWLAILPADSGPERQVQHPAIGHGGVRASLQAAGHAGADPVAGPDAKPFPSAPAAIEFDRVWFAYKDEDWVLTRRELPDRAGRDHRRGGPHRRGQNHAHQPAAALL